jgi:hypothetical protein
MAETAPGFRAAQSWLQRCAPAFVMDNHRRRTYLAGAFFPARRQAGWLTIPDGLLRFVGRVPEEQQA